MCGIFILVNKYPNISYDFNSIKHRGPENTNWFSDNFIDIFFHRLSINDTSVSGNQPFNTERHVLVCNGQIYNHESIKGDVNSNSDCEKLLPLFSDFGFINGVRKIDGVFALGYYDKVTNNLLVARDPVGIRPLFYGTYKDSYIFTSEMKAIPKEYSCNVFPPGHIFDLHNKQFFCYKPLYWNQVADTYIGDFKEKIYNDLELAVSKRITNSDRPIGMFLSGGLDSTIVSFLATELKQKNQVLKTFSIGTHKDSPDLVYARRVAKLLGTEHHEVLFTPEDAFSMIPEIIYQIETYDITTIRASTPMYILCKWIKEHTDVKVLLSGEGSDEIFGGYLYFHKYPSPPEFHSETIRLVQNLHKYDVLRADRCTASHGLEVRVPFLDINFLNAVMSMPVKYKLPDLQKPCIEKRFLREIFSTKIAKKYVSEPEVIETWSHIIWRQKNAFSDAVGYDWVDYLRTKVNEKEHYASIFQSLYPFRSNVIGDIWLPQWTDEKDPSARNLKEFNS